MLVPFQPPALREGQTHKGPDYYKSSDSGHAPVIHRTKKGHKPYIVCHHGDLPEATRLNEIRDPKAAVTSSTGRKMYFYSQRDAAESRYRAMCQAQIETNRCLHERHTNIRRKPTTRAAIVVAV